MKRVYSKSREENYTVTVDWNLGNRCNVQCSYCHPWFKSGSNRFPDIENAKRIVDQIAQKHRASNRLVRFSFVGGEPTLWDNLPQLCRHIKESAWYQVSIATNGTASLKFWNDILPWVDIVNLTYHEGTGFDHTVEVVQLLRSHHKIVHVMVAMMPETFDKSTDRIEQLRDDGISVSPQPLYSDHAMRKNLMPYSGEQLAYLFPNRDADMVVETSDGIREIPSSDHMIYRKQNSFTGMKCGIGTDQIVIDQDGTIRGGWCRVGGVLGNVHTGVFEMPTEPIVCTKETCNNPNDLAVPKWTD